MNTSFPVFEKYSYIPIIAGPTASGKSALALEICKIADGELVCADSMQIYENMDIATAKPTVQELSRVKHHLIGFVPMGEPFSVAKYKEKATQAIDDILSRGKLPVVVGGTGFYIDTLVKNTEFFDYEESNLRVKLEERLEKEGAEALFQELKSIDPKAAEKLHINDTKRIIRALEVYHLTGKTITQQEEESHLKESEYNWCLIGLKANDRQFLYDRINKRVDIMLEMGLLKEAEEFFNSNISQTAAQAIGYKELKPYIDGFVTLDEALEKYQDRVEKLSETIEDIESNVGVFWDKHCVKIKPFYFKQRKEDDVIVSACLDVSIAEVCKRLGIKNYIASETDIENHKLISFCFRENKVKAFKAKHQGVFKNPHEVYTSQLNNKKRFDDRRIRRFQESCHPIIAACQSVKSP